VLLRGDTLGDAWWRKLERLTQIAQQALKAAVRKLKIIISRSILLPLAVEQLHLPTTRSGAMARKVVLAFLETIFVVTVHRQLHRDLPSKRPIFGWCMGFLKVLVSVNTGRPSLIPQSLAIGVQIVREAPASPRISFTDCVAITTLTT
jgi:hypothetical protein